MVARSVCQVRCVGLVLLLAVSPPLYADYPKYVEYGQYADLDQYVGVTDGSDDVTPPDDNAQYMQPKKQQNSQQNSQALDNRSTSAAAPSESALAWIDSSRAGFKQQLDGYAQNIDNYLSNGLPSETTSDELGEQAAAIQHSKNNRRARAELRLYVDNDWNEYDGFNTKVRLRGNLELPTAQRRLKLVFGDDSVDDDGSITELDSQNQVAVLREGIPEKKSGDERYSHLRDIRRDAVDDNQSFALRLSRDLSDRLDTDVDLGLRSGVSDVYLRGRLDYKHTLSDIYRLDSRQTLRYGSESKLYLNSRWDISRHTHPHIHNNWHSSFSHSDENKNQGITWFQRLSRHHQLGRQRQFSYGVLVSGQFGKDDAGVSTYGPWVGYEQPIIREWIKIETNVSYLRDLQNDHSQNERDWHPTAFVRLGLYY